jgi:transposase-like protein
MDVNTSELAASKRMRRKFWSAAQKQQIVEEANAAGANAAEVAQLRIPMMVTGGSDLS